MSFSDNTTIRDVTQLLDPDMVPEAAVESAKLTAYRIIYKNLTTAFKAKVDGGTLTDSEQFDLKIGEAQLAGALLCRSMATRFTLYKFNRSIASGIGGGQSERDSRKNLDFKSLASDWMEAAWGILAGYLESVPRIGNVGGVDPYTNFDFSAVKNENLDALSEEEESIAINWG